jgi:hypothetical protein
MLSKKLFLLYCLLSLAIFSTAQKTVETTKANVSTNITNKDVENLPFTRNFNNFTIQQNFGWARTTPENSDNHTSSAALKIDYNRFVVDHVGVGAEFDWSSSKYDNGTSVSKDNSWMLYGNVIYGSTLGSNFNLYGKASVGLGQDKSTYGSSSSTTHLFGYKFEVGSPVHLFNDGGNYITPFISYNFLREKDDITTYKTNEFDFGFRFQNYSPCSAYQCDCHHNRSFSGNIYSQGRSFIGYSSMGDFGFGKAKTEYNNSTSESDISGGSFNLEYGYYLSRDIAIGAGFSWNGSTQKTGSSKYSNSALSFMPMITLNAPAKSCLENLFLQGGYGFGMEKSTSGSSEDKYNTTNLCINLGFNDFIGKHIAFTPKIGYEWESFKNTDTNLKSKQSGLEFGLGGSLHW